MKNTIKPQKVHPEKSIWIVLLTILIGIVTALSSCSVEKSFTQKEKELCTPSHITYKIIKIDNKYVYLENHNPVRISGNQTFKEGNYLLLPVQFAER